MLGDVRGIFRCLFFIYFLLCIRNGNFGVINVNIGFRLSGVKLQFLFLNDAYPKPSVHPEPLLYPKSAHLLRRTMYDTESTLHEYMSENLQ